LGLNAIFALFLTYFFGFKRLFAVGAFFEGAGINATALSTFY